MEYAEIIINDIGGETIILPARETEARDFDGFEI